MKGIVWFRIQFFEDFREDHVLHDWTSLRMFVAEDEMENKARQD